MGRVARRADGGVSIAAHHCFAVHTALVRLERAFMTFLAGRAAYGGCQGLRPYVMSSVAVRTYGGLPVALREHVGVDTALMLLVLVRVTSFAYPCKGDRELALVLERLEGMTGLRIFAVALRTFVTAVDRPP